MLEASALTCIKGDRILFRDLYFAPKFLTYTKMLNINGQQKEVRAVRSLADLSDEEMGLFI